MQIESIKYDRVPLIIQTKTQCTKMTDESDLVKNGINGAPAIVTANDRRITTNKQEKVFGSNNDAAPEAGTARVKGEFAHISNNKETCVPTSNIAWTITTLKQEEVFSSNETLANANAARVKCEIAQISNEKESRNLSSSIAWTQAVSDATAAIGGLDVHSSQSGIGGRLQFFKDGKFILELARTREGEKEGWVSVPRKTYWPLSTTTLIYTKNESSASLSFSDDNSSIQSSPWQRDHCWKQTSPRRNISKEMCMFFKRTRKFMLSEYGYKIAHIKRRKPYDHSVCKMPFKLSNGLIQSNYEDTVDGAVLNINQKTVNEEGSSINGENKKPRVRAKLSVIIKKLIDRLPTGLFYLSKTAIIGGTVPPFSGTPSRLVELHNPQQHVSPRKRILRELEKVSLEDNTNKRCRAKSSTIFSPSINTTTLGTSTLTTSNNQKNFIANAASGQITNGNTIEQNTPITTSSRLYSSYSIHSLLGNISSNNKSEAIPYQNTKEVNDPSYLRIMLATPKPSDSNNHFGKSSAFINNVKKSPTYSTLRESNCKSPVSETDNNLGRLKTLSTATSSTSFHPYLSSQSPKYSSSSCVSTNTSSDSFKIRTGRTSASPNHTHVSGSNRSSPLSAFSHSSQSSTGSRYCNRTSPSNSRMKELSPSDNISPKLERREGTPRTVPKKTAALRQKFISPSSSPSTFQADPSLTYTTSNDHKKRSADERPITPEKQIYHHAVDIEHSMSNVLRSSALPPSALYYMYPRHGSPSGHSTTPSYIPPVSYYHPAYAAAVAALRNPLWMHYQTGVMPPTGPPSRLGSPLFPYNGTSPGVPQIPLPLASMHLPTGSVKSWHTPASQYNLSTDDPVSLASKRDEPSSDTPLNLSKH